MKFFSIFHILLFIRNSKPLLSSKNETDMRLRHILTVFIVILGISLTPVVATGETTPLNILLTNDDGYLAPGITALHTALTEAGHNVTLVAPATQQSGKGGSFNSNVFDFSEAMKLTNHGDNVWSLEGTPVDSVKAGLDIILQGNPPDLIVSGLNSGENNGKPSSSKSGTVGAALEGTFRGIPSIAGSVQILLAEILEGHTDSTDAAFEPASDFIVRSIASLVAKNGNAVLPKHIRMLVISFPVPYEDIQGVKITALADGSSFNQPLFDPGFPPCSTTVPDTPDDFCYAVVGFGLSPLPDPVKKSDLDALFDGYITITPYDADMTGKKTELQGTLGKLNP